MPKTTQITQAGLDTLKKQLKVVNEKLAKTQKQDRGTQASWGGSFEKERLQNELYLLNERKREIEEQLDSSEVIEDVTIKDHIALGAQAKLLINKEEVTYMFVSAPEADPSKGHISIESPIGEALAGHKEGKVITVNIPSGNLTVTIFEIF